MQKCTPSSVFAPPKILYPFHRLLTKQESIHVSECFFVLHKTILGDSNGDRKFLLSAQLVLTKCSINQNLNRREGKNTEMGSHSLLQGIFLTQGLNPGLLPFMQILCHLSHQGSPHQLYLTSKKSILPGTFTYTIQYY